MPRNKIIISTLTLLMLPGHGKKKIKLTKLPRLAPANWTFQKELDMLELVRDKKGRLIQDLKETSWLFLASIKGARPGLVVFDPDKCIWNKELFEMPGGPPFTYDEEENACIDKLGQKISFRHPTSVIKIWKILQQSWQIPIAIACTSPKNKWCRELMKKFKVNDKDTMHDAVGKGLISVSTASKKTHLTELSQKSGVKLKTCLFLSMKWNTYTPLKSLVRLSSLPPMGLRKELSCRQWQHSSKTEKIEKQGWISGKESCILAVGKQ
eukprot:gnl/MRDRNA2_/MRDRNA2_81078_c0_seq1.p1 gnl/MRDRNA2_/MRDRNA2_81078_c0~~gnl/MRDRNA2_/MRDRNA2_81078_c0_seq1.p1  ORF type:complete len:267 (+),score=36.68 gnl/MRDRNA2_/MRDRNA2_81078_c0_seq1:175-975(+)